MTTDNWKTVEVDERVIGIDRPRCTCGRSDLEENVRHHDTGNVFLAFYRFPDVITAAACSAFADILVAQ